MSEKQLSATQASINVSMFDAYGGDMAALIARAIAAETQFSASHDGRKWSVSVHTPPVAVAVSEPAVA